MSGHSLFLRFTKQHRAVELSCEGPGIQTDVGDMWRDQNEQQVQNVFKRFLFHYSKANSVGSIQHASHSVHPLMRLSPKLSQRRKKQLLLLKLRNLPEGVM
ncbi:neuromedin-U-like isoform X2 [Oncorhynchus nerka]|uniref:neuromedin-U-like isoform X2 n=1 Tax=Oncorhynchus nerka TaxID=8023 RepID=UPI00113052E0|nr:neuromedin-U-like isoform X2 [Oncorhynchus nerka]